MLASRQKSIAFSPRSLPLWLKQLTAQTGRSLHRHAGMLFGFDAPCPASVWKRRVPGDVEVLALRAVRAFHTLSLLSDRCRFFRPKGLNRNG